MAESVRLLGEERGSVATEAREPGLAVEGDPSAASEPPLVQDTHPRPPTPSAAQPSARARGSTTPSKQELALGLFLLVLVVAAVLHALADSLRTLRAQREADRATEAARAQLEVLRARPLAQVWALYNDDPYDDPGGAASAPGARFEVAGLRPVGASAVGRIEFPDQASPHGGLELREDRPAPGLGTPLDLNLDGELDAASHGADYRILPVRVVVEWEGAAGRQSYDLFTVLGELP